jgi:hypothetical protein
MTLKGAEEEIFNSNREAGGTNTPQKVALCGSGGGINDDEAIEFHVLTVSSSKETSSGEYRTKIAPKIKRIKPTPTSAFLILFFPCSAAVCHTYEKSKAH